MYLGKRIKRLFLLIMLSSVWACTSEVSYQVKNTPEPKDIVQKEDAKQTHTVERWDMVSPVETIDTPQDTQNAPPEITQVAFIPNVFHAGDRLGVYAIGHDKDGDSVTFRYTWYINDQFSGNNKYLEEPVKRGDHLTVQVTPYDGDQEGRTITLERDILNLPPMIRTTQQIDFDGETYIYQVAAEDPDGDKLKFSLSDAPEGMTIANDSGLIIWNVPKEYVGTQNVSILVEDGHGGRAQYNMNVTIKLEEVSS